MKKVLLGSTALVAAGLIAGDPAAADGVKLSLGGYYRGVAGVMFDDFDGAAAGLEDDLRDYVFSRTLKCTSRVKPPSITASRSVRSFSLRARPRATRSTKSMLTSAVAGASCASATMTKHCLSCVRSRRAPRPTSARISPFFSFSNSAAAGALAYAGTNGTCYGTDSHSTKLIYFSPNWGGFSFAASFTPDGTQDTRNTVSGAGTRFENNPGQLSDNVSLAANFNHDFNGVTLNIGGGATWNLDREGLPGVDETEEYQGYASVGFFGFTIGGAIDLRNNFGVDGSDRLVYGAGLTYDWDAWTVGIGWAPWRYRNRSAYRPHSDQRCRAESGHLRPDRCLRARAGHHGRWRCRVGRLRNGRRRAQQRIPGHLFRPRYVDQLLISVTKYHCVERGGLCPPRFRFGCRHRQARRMFA